MYRHGQWTWSVTHLNNSFTMLQSSHWGRGLCCKQAVPMKYLTTLWLLPSTKWWDWHKCFQPCKGFHELVVSLSLDCCSCRAKVFENTGLEVQEIGKSYKGCLTRQWHPLNCVLLFGIHGTWEPIGLQTHGAIISDMTECQLLLFFLRPLEETATHSLFLAENPVSYFGGYVSGLNRIDNTS